MTLPRGMAPRMREVATNGGILIQIMWDGEAKQWLAVASLHGSASRRVQVIQRRIDATGAPDLDDVRRLLGAIQRECESWLW